MTAQAPLTFTGVLRAARAALQWRLMLMWVLCMLLPTAILGLTMWNMLSAHLDYSVHAASLARQLDMTVMSDLLVIHGKHSMAFNGAAVISLIVTLLLAPFLSGVAATAARADAAPGFRALVSGALTEYPRMFRMMLCSLIPLGIAVILGSAAMEAAGENAHSAILESDARLWNMLALALSALLLALAHATLDAGRAALVIDRRRTSALLAWWSGCQMLARRPLAGVGAYALITAAGLALAAALAIGRVNVAGASVGGFIGALLLVQLGVMAIGAMRSARLFAMVALARSERGQ
jgi:hypothetical protein